PVDIQDFEKSLVTGNYWEKTLHNYVIKNNKSHFLVRYNSRKLINEIVLYTMNDFKNYLYLMSTKAILNSQKKEGWLFGFNA
ncbi:unnamed protein product, partial [marine sediment metagenome]